MLEVEHKVLHFTTIYTPPQTKAPEAENLARWGKSFTWKQAEGSMLEPWIVRMCWESLIFQFIPTTEPRHLVLKLITMLLLNYIPYFPTV